MRKQLEQAAYKKAYELVNAGIIGDAAERKVRTYMSETYESELQDLAKQEMKHPARIMKEVVDAVATRDYNALSSD